MGIVAWAIVQQRRLWTDEISNWPTTATERSCIIPAVRDERLVTAHVLVPVDGSPLARDALRYALKTFPDAKITVLHVVDLFEPGYGAHADIEVTYEPLMGSEEWYERAEQVSAELLEEAAEIAAAHDREVATESDIGEPARIIVDYAAEEDVDHIVLGSHGRTEEERPVFGSITETVARRATVPVTIIR